MGAIWANEVVQVAFWAFVKVMIILNTLLFTHIASCFWAFLLVGNNEPANWLDG